MEKEIYDYLMCNCIGYENRVKAKVVMKKFGIKDHKKFRSYIQLLREDYGYSGIVGSEAGVAGGYWIVNNEKELENTIHHYKARANEMYTTANIIVDKWKRLHEA